MGLYISQFIAPFVGLTFPAYASFKAIESPQPEDDLQWLTYWVCYAIFAVFELFGDHLVYWMPFYYEAKIAALILLQLPGLHMGAQLYKTAVRPWFKAHEAEIDAWLVNLKATILSKAGEYIELAVQKGPGFLLTAVNAVKGMQASAAAEKEKDKGKEKADVAADKPGPKANNKRIVTAVEQGLDNALSKANDSTSESTVRQRKSLKESQLSHTEPAFAPTGSAENERVPSSPDLDVPGQ